MTLQAIPGGMWIPEPQQFSAVGAGSFSSFLINASGEKVAFIVRAPKAGQLEAFEFLLRAVGQPPSNGLTCSFQDVSLTDGNPDGIGDQSITVTTGLTTDAWVAPNDFNATRTVTAGQRVACVIEFAGFSASDSLNIGGFTTNANGALVQDCYISHFTNAWAKATGTAPTLALRYSDGSYDFIPEALPMTSLNGVTIHTGTTPDELGMIFQFPVPVTVGGAWFRYDPVAAGRNLDVILYDSNGTTALETITYDGDVVIGPSGRNTFVRFVTARTLLANTTYRLAMKPGAGSNMTVYDVTVNTASLLNAWPGGSTWHRTERTDNGAWSQTTTRRPWMGLLVTAVDDGATSTRMLTTSGMVGGLRG